MCECSSMLESWGLHPLSEGAAAIGVAAPFPPLLQSSRVTSLGIKPFLHHSNADQLHCINHEPHSEAHSSPPPPMSAAASSHLSEDHLGSGQNTPPHRLHVWQGILVPAHHNTYNMQLTLNHILNDITPHVHHYYFHVWHCAKTLCQSSNHLPGWGWYLNHSLAIGQSVLFSHHLVKVLLSFPSMFTIISMYCLQFL